MSAGDKNDPVPFTFEQANTIIRLPLVDRYMRRGYQVNPRDFDIPYLAGYSRTGISPKTIYIDRDLGQWSYLSQRIDTDRFLLLHEHVETSLIDAIKENEGLELQRLLILLRMTGPDDQIYYHCHGVATACEEYMVKLQYGASGVASYNRFMLTQIKRAEDERIRRVPSDLDMTPYEGDDPMDVRLRRVMEMRMAA
jgi:hypothetical protein